MNQKIITTEMLNDLPEPVRRYLQYTGVVGQPWIENVWLKQIGRFRQGLDKPWMPMVAEQKYTTEPAGFVWNAKFKMAGIPLLRAVDTYKNGKGHMLGKLAGMIKLFDVRGEKLDQGAMLRYLSEMIWFPAAFLGENISWQSRDEYSAQVTFTDYGKSVHGIMHFDEEGRITNFTAKRYQEVAGEFSLESWSTPVTEYGRIAGLNLPIKGQAIWNLPSGDLPYIELEITEIAYNQTAS
jgi:hypothetical protein